MVCSLLTSSRNSWEFSKLITFNQVRGAFGFNESTNIGRIFFPALQCVAAFATSYPEVWYDEPPTERQAHIAKLQCLIPCAIDQDVSNLLHLKSYRILSKVEAVRTLGNPHYLEIDTTSWPSDPFCFHLANQFKTNIITAIFPFTQRKL
jgi:hypothetical protein